LHGLKIGSQWAPVIYSTPTTSCKKNSFSPMKKWP
jgi:hypothetical protein